MSQRSSPEWWVWEHMAEQLLTLAREGDSASDELRGE